jgi:hypothetical protein
MPKVLVILLMMMSFLGFAQQEVSWNDLNDVRFEDRYSEEVEAYYWFPVFGESVKDLEGKEILIKGYMIPVSVEENYYVLSAFPFSNCFFCGGAGPESVMGLNFKGKNREFHTDEFLTFKGILRLNETDIYEMNYILDEAQLVK